MNLYKPEAAVASYCSNCVCVCVSLGLDSFTSIGGRLNGGWQLDAIIHPLSVTNPASLTALNPLLHQEAESIARILRACAVPLQKQQHLQLQGTEF